MMRTHLGLLGILCAGPALSVAADDGSRDLATLFPHEAPIYVSSDRLSQLELPPEVLTSCRADLSDLRVFDQNDREVSFLIDGGLARDQGIEITQRITPQLFGVEQQRTHRETGPSLWRETYEIALPEVESSTGLWDLVIDTDRPRFVRLVHISIQSNEGERLVVEEEASIYRLTSPPRERVRITLPELTGERLFLDLTGEDGFYLSPGFRFENTRTLRTRDRLTIELEEMERDQHEGRTVLQLQRPRGLVPDSLRLTTSTSTFNRPMEIWDDGPGAQDAALAEETVYRVQALTTLEEVEVPLAPARGDRLRVVIHDGDSPPLHDLTFQAVVRRPALLFSLDSRSSASPAGTLRFGGGRAFRPHYDLAGLPAIGAPAEGDAARIAEQLSDPSHLVRAELGPIRPNELFDPAPALGFAMRPGTEIDPRPFSHQRRLLAQPSAEGLCRLGLEAEDLAHARADLADIRIVDSESKQWAYLIEKRAALDLTELFVTQLSTQEGRTRIRFGLPATPLTLDHLVLESPVPFFDRSFVLKANTDEGSRESVTLATGRLSRRIGDPRPVTIAFPPTRLFSLELEILDGDDAPLELTRATSRLPVPDLYFAAPTGPYHLLLGNPEIEAPSYELSRVRQIVLAVESSEVDAGPLVDNPEFRPGARLATQKGVLQIMLWTVVIGVVVFLSVLTLRLARQEGGDGPKDQGAS